MNPQLKTIREVCKFLTQEGIPYALIGGIALQWWGEPRFTRDVDLTILVNFGEEEAVIKRIFSVFSSRIPDGVNFALKNRICLIRSKEGYEVDMSLGIPGYEEEVMNRAIECPLEKGYSVKICSPEDLIIHKAVAGRPRDSADIESVIMRQGKKLDLTYLRKWLKEFTKVLGTPEILARFEKPLKELMGKSR